MEEEILKAFVGDDLVLDDDNFQTIKDVKSSCKIGFIDGGNSTILQSSSSLLEFIRVYYVIYEDGKKIFSEKKECYMLIRSEERDDRLVFSCRCYPLNYDIGDFVFDGFDRELRFGNEQVEISRIGGVVRKLAELKVIDEVIDHVKGGFIVLDGDLDVKHAVEKVIMDKILVKASGEKVKIAGLSKTSSLLKNGKSVVGNFSNVKKEGAWHYGLDEGKSIVKLHEKSRYVFRFDFKGDFSEILGVLKSYSRDISVLGYPYGLFEADRMGRVSNSEKEYLANKFLFKAENKERVMAILRGNEFHGVLDSIG